MDIKRSTRILTFLQKKQSVMVLGPRGTGKSFYLTRALQNLDPSGEDCLEINLLDVEIFKRYLLNPSLLITEMDKKLESRSFLMAFIDEIQKLPQLLDIVHLLLEKYPTKLQFILTGSSARKLKKADANLLAGRVLMNHFTNFTFEEISFERHLNQIIQFGLLPKVFLQEDEDIKIEILKSYTGTYLKEEIMQEALVRNIEGFNLFLELSAQLNGTCINYAKMAKQIKISDYTIREHYKILEDTLIAHKIPAWSHSLKKQLQNAPKFYFFDNGVLNALKGELRTELRMSSFRYGQLFENLVVNEMIKHNEIKGFDYKLYHYRTYAGGEIDLILQKTAFSKPVAIEIKSQTAPTPLDCSELLTFKKDFPDSHAFVLCLTPRAYSIDGLEFLNFPEGIKTIFDAI